MPYIKPQERPQYDVVLDKLPEIQNKGHLEYCIFKVVKKFMETREKRYGNYHDCVYGVEHCSDEYRRRFLDKREDQAIQENGDV